MRPSVRLACYTERVEYPRRSAENACGWEEDTTDCRTHVLLALSEFRAQGYRERGVHIYRGTLYTAEHFYESHAAVYTAPRQRHHWNSTLERKIYTRAASSRKQMAYISDVGKEEEEEEEKKEKEGKKRTEFKHIRERCLKNNHGARKRGGGSRKGGKRSAREQRGWSGSTGAINSPPPLPLR